ncbi:hypothetical protein MMMDOFMJ_4612 [Methylobacterium gnaphalii]|nr:hypothetical protein MMMDOFMJ_4612 [Methylobacterium gnaphalii]
MGGVVVTDTREHHRAAGPRVVAGIDRAETQRDRTELGAAVDGAEAALDLGRLRASGRVEVGAGVAAGHAEAETVLQAHVGTGHEPRRRAVDAGGVAVGLGMAEAAEALSPDAEHARVEHAGRHHSCGDPTARQVGGVGRRQRAVIRALRRAAVAQTVEDRLTHEERRLEGRTRRARMDVAGESLEGALGLCRRQAHRRTVDARVRTRALHPIGRRSLVAVQRHRGEGDVVAGQRQVDFGRLVAQRGGEEGEVRGHARELASDTAGRGQDRILRARVVSADRRENLHGAALKRRRARGRDLVGLAGRIGLDKVGRACREGYVAGDVQRADRVARRHRRARLRRDPSDRARAAEKAAVLHDRHAGDGAVGKQRAAIADGHVTGHVISGS